MHVETAKVVLGGNEQRRCRGARDGTAPAMEFLAADDSSALVAAAQETSRTPLPLPRQQTTPPSRLPPRGLARAARSPAATRARPRHALAGHHRTRRLLQGLAHAACSPAAARSPALACRCDTPRQRRPRTKRRDTPRLCCACSPEAPPLRVRACSVGRPPCTRLLDASALARRCDTPRPCRPRRDTAQVCCACSLEAMPLRVRACSASRTGTGRVCAHSAGSAALACSLC
jgi:hypothetical protein